MLRRRSKNRSTADMVKKRSSIDEKLKVQVWIQPRMKTVKIALRQGHGESTIRRRRAKLKDMLPGASPSRYWLSQVHYPC